MQLCPCRKHSFCLLLPAYASWLKHAAAEKVHGVAKGWSRWYPCLNGTVLCRVALLLQHQLRGQCGAAAGVAAAAVAAIAVLAPPVEVSPQTPAGLEVCSCLNFAIRKKLNVVAVLQQGGGTTSLRQSIGKSFHQLMGAMTFE